MKPVKAVVWVTAVVLAVWSGATGPEPVVEPLFPQPSAASSAASTTTRATDRFPTSAGEIVVTPLEHASLLFGWDGKAIYVDPTSTAILDEKLPRADLILVTEAKFDHLDASAIERLSKPGTIVVAPSAVAEVTHVGEVVGQHTVLVMGMSIIPVPIYHGSDPAKGGGYGYVIRFLDTEVYVSGDTRCPSDLRAYDRNPIDAAFVSVRAPMAMTHVEAARCMEALHARVVFPYHDRGEDLSDLANELASQGIDVRRRNFHPRPENLRLRAFESCDTGHFGVCRDDLDKAELLDPRSELDPRVIQARKKVGAWRWPFPSWW